MSDTPSEPELAENPAFNRFLTALTQDVRSTFSAAQLAAVERGMRPTAPRHRVDFRVSIPWRGRRYYIAIFAGRERRSLARLKQEGQMSIGRVAATYGALMSIIGALLILSGVVLAFSIGKVFEDPMASEARHLRLPR